MSTSGLAAGTGSPPAIRWEDLQDWNVLADNIDAALKMGGEQGMDLLLGIMTDWCRVVDEINTAYQICCGLAARGLRDEAMQWHAEGFFDVADRLDPDRPGWEMWEKVLSEQGVILPSLDVDAKSLVNQIFEDMTAMHINGQVLQEEVRALRRNMLIRGELSERVTVLNRLQEIDPTNPNWREMLRPYRRRRAGELAGEVDAFVEAEDVRGLCRLNAEVERQNWDDEIPAESRATLVAAVGWLKAEKSVGLIRQELAELVVRCRQGQNTDYGSVTYQNAIKSARTHRDRIVGFWKELRGAVVAAEGCPRIRRIVRERALIENAQSLEARSQREAIWLQEQDSFEQWIRKFGELDDAIAVRLRKEPKYRFPDFDAYKKSAKKWLKGADELLDYSRKLCKHAPMIPKVSEDLIARLVATRQSVEGTRDSVFKTERNLLFGFFGGLVVLVAAAIFIAISFG